MIRTRVGYAGGRTEAPNYRHMGDHTETVQMDYDPSRITYGELLDIFWEGHDPTSQSWSKQYRNAVFVHNEEQRRQAMESKSALEKRTGKTVRTNITDIRSFTPAEDYHQKYLLKQHPLRKEMERFYPRHQDLVDSTAAARLNGYLGGEGTREQLFREIESLGMSDEGKERLTGMGSPGTMSFPR